VLRGGHPLKSMQVLRLFGGWRRPLPAYSTGMNNRTALDTLQQLAQKETDGAARRLTSALEQQTSAKQKLEMLLELRAEYTERLLRQSREGMSIAAIKNFQAFMKKIDEAIALQTDYAKSSYEDFVAEASKIGEIYTSIAKEAFKPLQSAAKTFTPAE